MNKRNRRGPSIDPWETPDLITFGVEMVPLRETHWVRLLRYDLNYLFSIPVIPSDESLISK